MVQPRHQPNLGLPGQDRASQPGRFAKLIERVEGVKLAEIVKRVEGVFVKLRGLNDEVVDAGMSF